VTIATYHMQFWHFRIFDLFGVMIKKNSTKVKGGGVVGWVGGDSNSKAFGVSVADISTAKHTLICFVDFLKVISKVFESFRFRSIYEVDC
jgi:hypothetical protein